MLFRNIHEARAFIDERMPSLDANKKAIMRDVSRGDADMRVGKLREALGTDIFDAVTLDASHNSLQKGYGTVPDHWREIASVVSLSDFKSRNSTALSGLSNPLAVAQNQPYGEVPLIDEKVTYAPSKYGNIIRLSLEAMANDEMGAFQTLVEKQGAAFKNGLNEYVLGTLFDDAPACDYDTVALFHSSHANVQTSSALSLSTVESALKILAVQTGRKGEQIYAYPTKLAVHPALAITAANILNSTAVVGGSSAGPASNAIAGLNLGLLVSPHLNAVTAGTQWYLLSNIPVVEVGFLNGRTEPEVFMEPENTGGAFNTDSIAWKFRLVYGGDVIDHRGAVRSTAP